MNDLVPAFEKSLFEPIVGISSDFIEVGIDSVLKDGLFKDIPIVNSVVGVIKFGIGIKERNFLMQTLNFINEFNSGNIKPEKLEKYRKK